MPSIRHSLFSPLATAVLGCTGLAALASPTPIPGEPVRQYIFGHSLINHESAAITLYQGAVPYWMDFLIDATEHAYAVDGQYGFIDSHANTLPPDCQWYFGPGVPTVCSEGNSDWPSLNFNSIMLTPNNFIQWLAPDDPVNGSSGPSAVDYTVEIFDYVQENTSGARLFIYQNWPPFDPFFVGSPITYPPSSTQMSSYHDYTRTGWDEWWEAYLEQIRAARPSYDIEMLSVAPIMSALLSEAPYDSIPSTALYEDDAPHGRETVYFIAALITYMAMFDERAPYDMAVPDTIHATIRTNYNNVVDFIWQAVQDDSHQAGNMQGPDAGTGGMSPALKRIIWERARRCAGGDPACSPAG